MDKNIEILYKCPHPFMIVELIGDQLNIIEHNIKNTNNNNINIDDIKNNEQVKGLVENYINENIAVANFSYLKNTYKLTFDRMEENKIIIWFEVEENSVDVSKINFLSNLTHEFKTPLNLIFSSIQLINKKIEKNKGFAEEEISKYLKIINQNSYRILKLINNISDDNKIDLGYSKYSPINEDLIYFIETICESINSFVVSNNMSIIFDTDIEELMVAFDIEKMERILLNLISNAIKFRKPYDGTITISISHNEDYVNISVKDNGIGIEKDNLDKIFKKYVRLNDKRSLVREGSGIGLSLVDSLVKEHSGVISVDSIFGEWTEFMVSIPNRTIENENNNMKDKCIVDRVEKIKIEFSDIYA